MVKGYENKRIIIKCFVLFLWWLFRFLLFLLFRMVLLVLSLRYFIRVSCCFYCYFFWCYVYDVCSEYFVYCIISDFACYVDMYFYWCRLSYQTVSSFIFRTFMTSRGLFACFRFVPGVLSTVCCDVYS